MRQPSEKHLKQFGQNVVRLRNDAGLTQEKLAERVQISSRYYQSIEAGKRWPTIGVLIRLRTEMECDWAAVFEGLE